jgi:hypothetical protein
MSRVKLFEEIRRERRDGASIRGLADAHGVHRRTVRQAVADAVPPLRKTPQRDAPVLGPWKDTIRGWLEADLEVRDRPGFGGDCFYWFPTSSLPLLSAS